MKKKTAKKNTAKKKNQRKKFPQVGDKIYVPSAFHVYRGRDDFRGGLCTINRVEESRHLPQDHYNYWFVGTEEGDEATSHNWRYLMERQQELKKEFGNKKGRKDPDMSPEFNNDNEGWQHFHR